MNTDQLNSFVRSILKIVGAYLIAHGMTETASIINTPDVTGLVLTVAGLIWSHFSHNDTTPPPASKLPPIVLLLTISLAIGGFGCAGTTAQQIAFRTAGTTAVSVATGMQGFNQVAKAGLTTPAQNAAVKSAYEKYQAGFSMLCDAGGIYAASSDTNSPAASALTQATVNVANEMSDLETLLQQCGVKVTLTNSVPAP